ncbi:glycosyltransferase family 39 protein [bacterium]|nr:glycosyltransferase family 39 protein [bacterium]
MWLKRGTDSPYRTMVLLVLLGLAGLALRIGYGWDRTFWLDEAQSIYNAEKGARYLLSIDLGNTITDIHPPLYYLVLWAWRHLFSGYFGLRSLSLLFGMFALVFLYLLIKDISGPRTALIATTLSTFSVPHLHYSLEVRMYSLTLFLALINIWLFLKWTKERTRGQTIGYILSAVAALYAYHFLVFLFLVQWLYIGLIFNRDRKILPQWLLINGVLLICYLPGLYRLQAQLQFVGQDFWGIRPSLLEIPGLFFWFVGDSAWHTNYFFKILIGSTWLIACLLGWLSDRTEKRLKIVLTTWLLLPPLAVILMSFRTPLYQPRYFLFTIPVFYYYVSIGLERIWATRIRASFMIVFVLVSLLALVLFVRYPQHLDIRPVLETIDLEGPSPHPVFHINDAGGNDETYILSRLYRPWATRDCILGEYADVAKELISIVEPSEICPTMAGRLEVGEPCWIVYERSFLRELEPGKRLEQVLPMGYLTVAAYHFNLVDLYLAAPGEQKNEQS